MDIKSLTAVAAIAFVQFRDPATDQPMTNAAGEPVGVEVYGPGSKQYRAAQSAIATANIKRGRKGLTGETLRENETELLARTTAKFVGFDYDGQAASVDVCRKFYDDVELAHLREQVVEKQGDFGNFIPTASTA